MGYYLDKKCKIITFHNAVNYGAVLQAFALKNVMSSFCETGIYDYCDKKMKRQYSINPFISKKRSIISRKLIRFVPHYKQKRKFKNFVKKYLIDNFDETNNTFYITGSDQVWNYNCTGFDKTYFLDFVTDSRLKNSYSASFGFDSLSDEVKDEYKLLLSDYNLISVRENEGAKIIKDLINRDVPVTLDPTLLLNKKDWENAFPEKKIKQKQYILVYAFHITDSMRSFILNLSKEKSLPVVILMPEKPLNKNVIIKDAIYKTSVSPEEWINYFLNASYVVTNSFHGTAFSVNFNKQFFVEHLNATQNLNSRINTLLGNVGLTDRIIDENIDIDSNIDFIAVNSILERKRKESVDYLKSIVDSYNE